LRLPDPLRARLARSSLDEDEFTRLCADAVLALVPGAQVAVLETLALKVERPEQGSLRLNLGDLWRQPPKARAEAIELHLSLLMPTKEPTRVEEIVPLLKTSEYVALAQAESEQVVAHLVGELWIAYFFELTDRFVPVEAKDLARLEVAQDDLRGLAAGNLRRVLPAVRYQGTPRTFILTGGGNFAASLLLLDELWSDFAKEVEGDLVAVAPNRDVLMASHTGSPSGVEKLRELAAKSHRSYSYPLSPELLVRREGEWRILDVQ